VPWVDAVPATGGGAANGAWNDHRLSLTEAETFARDGLLVLPGHLPEPVADRLEEAFDTVWAAQREAHQKSRLDKFNMFDFLSQDERFLEMIDWPATFPKVVDILGWNIQIYHTHMMITPGAGQGADPGKRGWHQDSDRLNRELETNPQPRVSLKVAFFLSDCSVAGRGNFGAVPGSHLTNALVDPERRDVDPPGATVVLVPRGGMVLFDRRIWHTGTENYADYPRKALFYGYSYRWLRPRDDMRVAHYLERCDPIRRQLLGTSPSGGRGYTSPQPEDVPLRAWLERNPTDPTVAAAAGAPPF
jgi:ectoine hydroxylase-related dioxygenase (phytanoyl-CoA dioxygenase family)